MSDQGNNWPLSRLAASLAYDALLHAAPLAKPTEPRATARGSSGKATHQPRAVPLEGLLRAAVALDVLATLTTYVRAESTGALPLSQAVLRAAQLSGASPEALDAITATTQGPQGEARCLAAAHVLQAVEGCSLADDDAVLRLIEAAAHDTIATARLRLQARDQQTRRR